MSITDVFLIIASVGLLLMVAGVNANVQKLSTQVSNNQAGIQTLFEDFSNVKSQMNSFKLSKPFMKYPFLLENAPRVLPSYPLVTVIATDLEDFIPALSTNSFYEITKMNEEYFLAYPGIGTTFLIQVLSSSYSDKVLKIVNSLRGKAIPAFEIIYENTAALFVDVFPNYELASKYASSVSTILYPTVKSTAASWIVRQIP